MLLGIVNRMILIDLIRVFLMSLVALTGMFLLAGLIQEASKNGLSPTQIILAIPLIVPNTLPFTIPATTLFASCVVYGRMSADNEVLVLRAAGVNIYRLLGPALILGTATMLITAALYYEPIARSQQLLREQLLRESEDILYGQIKREGGMKHSSLDFVMFVREVQGRDLIDVVLKKRRPDRNGYEFVARSQSARLRVRNIPSKNPTAEGSPEIGEKEVVIIMDRCFVDSQKGDVADLQQQVYAMPMPTSVFGKPNKDRPSSQTWKELFANLDRERRDLGVLTNEVGKKNYDAAVSVGAGKAGRTSAESEREKDQYNLKIQRRVVRAFEIEIQLRPALAVGCLCFAVIGCPVGIWASRSDYLSVFMICFLPTVFIYYPLLLAGTNFGKDGKVPIYIVWTADTVAVLASMVLIKKLMKR